MKLTKTPWNIPRFLVVLLGLALVGVVGLIDYKTGWEFSFGLFYFLPIVVVTWGAGQWPAVAVALVCSQTWLVVDLINHPEYSHHAIPYWNSLVRLAFFLLFIVAVSLKNALDHERILSQLDPLTQIPNARSFYDALTAELNRAKRYRRPFTLAYLDLDNFKQVNDSFGHRRGDQVLQDVAQTMQNNIRITDKVARLGGDEFALLFPETEAEAAGNALRKLQNLVLEKMQAAGLPVTASIGAVTFREFPATTDELIRRADDLMYGVKKSGKNGINHQVFPGPFPEVKSEPMMSKNGNKFASN